MSINSQFAPPARSRKISTTSVEHHREEQRLDRCSPRIKKPERKSYYERQLEKFGIGKDE